MACSLQPDEWVERKKLIQQIGSNGVEDVKFDAEMLAFQFRATPELRGSLEKLIDLEATCCPFFEFELDEHDSSLTLTVQAPNGPATALDAIRHMFVSPAVGTSSR